MFVRLNTQRVQLASNKAERSTTNAWEFASSGQRRVDTVDGEETGARRNNEQLGQARRSIMHTSSGLENLILRKCRK